MTRFIGTLFILTTFLFLVLSPNKSFAWSCFGSQEPKEWFKTNDFVFIAKALDTTYEKASGMNPKSRTTFEVKSALKGKFNEKVTIVTTAGSEFLEGTEYLVYAYQTTESNYLYSYEPGEIATDTWCGGTKLLSQASYDLEDIAEYKKMNKLVYFTILPLFAASVIVALFVLIKQFNKGNLRRR